MPVPISYLEPVFFKHTQFLVDRFHYKGHKACSMGYNLDMYLDYNLISINSQVNEQANARSTCLSWLNITKINVFELA